MDTNTPEGIGNDEPLSMDEAVKAYAAMSAPEVEDDQAEEDATEAEDEAELSDDEEEDDGEPQEEDDAEEGDEEEELKAEGKFVSRDGKVRLPDGSVASIEDLIKGNLREADYTRKNQERAEKERQLESHRAQLTQYEQQLASVRDLTLQVLQSRMPKEPDADMLMADPIGYMQSKAQYDRDMAEYHRLQQTAAQAREHQQQIEAYQHQQLLAQEFEALQTKVPELSDPKARPAFLQTLVATAEKYGLSAEELGSITDHRIVVALRDLARLEGVQKAKTETLPKKLANKPPVQTGSKRLAPSEQKTRSADAALQRLNKSGSLRDGVAAYLATQKLR